MKKPDEFIPGRFYVNGYTREQALLSVSEGWHFLIHKIFDRLESETDKHIIVDQVKEKWGVLRVYTSPMDEDVDNFIISVQSESYKICEECGKVGKLSVKNGRYKVVCEDHNEGYTELKS